jgi:hypothetical protein
MGNLNSTCITEHVPVFTTQRCNVSPFASPNAMCNDPDPTKCNATTQLSTCAPGYNCTCNKREVVAWKCINYFSTTLTREHPSPTPTLPHTQALTSLPAATLPTLNFALQQSSVRQIDSPVLFVNARGRMNPSSAYLDTTARTTCR